MANPIKPEFEVELAPRQIDPYEYDFHGLIETNDPLLKERGENVEIYRNLKRDGRVFSCNQKLIGALVSRTWSATAIEEKHSADAEILTTILKRISFDQVCRDLLDAIIMGYSISEIVWGVSGNLIVPVRIIKRRQRRFKYRQIEKDGPPTLCLLTRENMLTGIPLPDKKFIVHRVNPEDDNPYGTGLGLQLFWPVFFKRKGVISWNKLCDRFGTPTPWGKYGPNTNKADKEVMRNALKAMSNDGFILTPDRMQVELIESKLTGTVTSHQALIEKMDEWIAEVLIGQEPKGESGGAQAAASKERAAVRLDLVQAHSDLLSETLNNTLVKWICEFNGLAPCVVYRQIKEEEDLKASSETDKNIFSMGFRPTEDYIHSKYGEGWERLEGTGTGQENGTGTEGKDQQDSSDTVLNKADAAMINADSMGLERLVGMNLKVPASHIYEKYNIPRPKPGEQLLEARQQPTSSPASFAEPDTTDPQVSIDNAIANLSDEEIDEAMAGLLDPLLAAIEGANSFEEALAAAGAALPDMDLTRLQGLLAQAMFGAELYGRVSND